MPVPVSSHRPVSPHCPVSHAPIWVRSKPRGSEDRGCPCEGKRSHCPPVTLPKLAPAQTHMGGAMGELCVGLFVWEAQRPNLLVAHGDGEGIVVPGESPEHPSRDGKCMTKIQSHGTGIQVQR